MRKLFVVFEWLICGALAAVVVWSAYWGGVALHRHGQLLVETVVECKETGKSEGGVTKFPARVQWENQLGEKTLENLALAEYVPVGTKVILYVLVGPAVLRSDGGSWVPGDWYSIWKIPMIATAVLGWIIWIGCRMRRETKEFKWRTLGVLSLLGALGWLALPDSFQDTRRIKRYVEAQMLNNAAMESMGRRAR
jgi:hypothetical protein